MNSPVAVCLFALLATNGHAAHGAQSATHYPAPISGFEEYERFPPEVQGYRRGAVTAYAPGLADYSIAYDHYDAELQNAVTLFFYDRPGSAESQLKTEVAQILRGHAGAKLVSQRSINIDRGNSAYEASLVTFEYEEIFAGTRQRLSSQLVLARSSAGMFKVRSTAPIAQAQIAEQAMLQLIRGIDWAP